MFLCEMFHEVCAYIPTGTEPAAGSEETAVAHLGLPEFPKEGVPATATKSKLPATGTHTLVGSESDLPSTSATPFVLSEGLPPVPAKLVAKIQRGDYVYMAELLRDNMEWERRRLVSESAGPKSGRVGRREVPTCSAG